MAEWLVVIGCVLALVMGYREFMLTSPPELAPCWGGLHPFPNFFNYWGEGHSGLALPRNFTKLKKKLTQAPKHSERGYQCQKYGNLPYSVHQWIGNFILSHFDPKMSSLGFLEAKIILKLRTMGNYCHGCDF